MNLLEFRNIKKKYGQRDVLSGVSFSIEAGEIFGLVGSSGCGKSTLLNILVGMNLADSGDIFFEGKNVLKDLNYLRKRTGFATQDNMLFEELSVKENSFYFGDLYGMKKRDIKASFEELLRLFKLEDFRDHPISQLSGGMTKRANLLVSLIHHPRLLILDEPTVGLDPILRSSLWEYIKKINESGMTILVTSHLLEEIEENCDRIGIMKRGKMIALAELSEYKERYGRNKNLNEIFQELVKNEGV